MKKILLPVDHSPLSDQLICYVADMNRDIPLSEVVLIKPFHIPAMAQIMPNADMAMISDDEFESEELLAGRRLNELAGTLREATGGKVNVKSQLVHEPWKVAIQWALSTERPHMLVLGHDPAHTSGEDQMSETAVSLASVSTAPVLLIPAGARYFLPSHMILPTPFENLERLSDFNKLFTNSLWRNVTIDVLQIGEDLEQKDEAIQALYEYLKGYQFGIHCIPGTDTAKEILHFADTRNAALILALPGRHSFFYHLSHQNVTKKFALLSQRPVLLLK